jgi:hypothetical protein
MADPSWVIGHIRDAPPLLRIPIRLVSDLIGMRSSSCWVSVSHCTNERFRNVPCPALP